ncbi:MAG: hypothetical protein ACYCQI_09150 [Gammaproteobacteria bacterium]
MRIILLLVCLLIPVLAFADDQITGVGKVASNILEPVLIVSDFVCSASIIIGVSSLFGAFLKYMQHRVNPLAAPMSTVVVMLVVGIVLVALPFVYLLTENGIPYFLLRK